MDASEVMIQKPGCVQNRRNGTQPTPTTPRPMIPLVNILYNSTIVAQEKSNDTIKETGAVLNSSAHAIQFNVLLLTFYVIFVWNKLESNFGLIFYLAWWIPDLKTGSMSKISKISISICSYRWQRATHAPRFSDMPVEWYRKLKHLMTI